MKRIILMLILITLIGCDQKVEENLEGKWQATAGYQDGEIKGEPNCYPFEKEIEFKEDNKVYVETYERDFKYWMSDEDGENKIVFNDSGPGLYSYQIKMLSENEMIITGLNLSEGDVCYLKRQ
ncbi:hypothetical protein GLV94_12450 [Virgibacillus halodenitrificans]|uniref:lipocalin family protein n=1 Tax=Virgibacillus halodenitrificans TaxID=1482 RepID=UPI00136DD2CE|nr:lipocalin family protein [Virgibacillus halodenitrificans]MYL46453.1 hypothetical protein [Virgibacillus halodenitrificans]